MLAALLLGCPKATPGHRDTWAPQPLDRVEWHADGRVLRVNRWLYDTVGGGMKRFPEGWEHASYSPGGRRAVQITQTTLFHHTGRVMDAMPVGDDAAVGWLDDDRLQLVDAEGCWTVDLRTESREPAPCTPFPPRPHGPIEREGVAWDAVHARYGWSETFKVCWGSPDLFECSPWFDRSGAAERGDGP
ncbi:MAG: hypothetical protein H6736_22365 [Alphaproteobacteria bacterium]|nr:hypothetical protein [Myxococcales bacterium]MCB9669837.1 hypothetical protein [Alphaproteobacteria bacterium]MCB9694563.1 hypothetical protein [Alphaproteobacteria bacterium]